MITKIKNGRFLLPQGEVTDVCLYFENDTITAITKEELPFDVEIDAGGQYVSPGFIDIHSHGGGGFDVMDGGVEPIIGAANLHLQHGTTCYMPTSLACSTGVLLEFLEALSLVMTKGLARSRIAGAHLEGPYFSHAQSGAQNPAYIIPPKPAEYNEIIEKYGSIIKRWSFAPEHEGSREFCKTLVKNGISPSIAHSDATYAEVLPAYEEGCRMVTHLYSGMSTIVRKGGFRHLGVVESTYLLDDMTAEVIADGCHLPPELLQLIVKQLGKDHVCLVTDAMRGAGMPDGPSLLGRKDEAMECVIEDGVAKLPDKSGFAGSVATADRLVRTMVQKVGLTVTDAVHMMTVNPARVLGCSDIGALQPGYKADIVFFDDNISVNYVIVDGKTVR